ncbi:MAG TPA: hypothetical protein VGE81_07605 [Candidatus Limnocylindrales bacterium]
MKLGLRWWDRKVRQLLEPETRCDCRTRHSPPPNLRTRVTPAVLAYWRRLGWTVHAVGRAIYAHDPADRFHLLVGCWPRRGPEPAWASRLGFVSAGWERRLDRLRREQRWRREARDAHGRFLALLPWWRWPQPIPYSWEV